MWTLTEYFIMGENLLKEIEKGSKMAVMKKKRSAVRSRRCMRVRRLKSWVDQMDL